MASPLLRTAVLTRKQIPSPKRHPATQRLQQSVSEPLWRSKLRRLRTLSAYAKDRRESAGASRKRRLQRTLLSSQDSEPPKESFETLAAPVTAESERYAEFPRRRRLADAEQCSRCADEKAAADMQLRTSAKRARKESAVDMKDAFETVPVFQQIAGAAPTPTLEAAEVQAVAKDVAGVLSQDSCGSVGSIRDDGDVRVDAAASAEASAIVVHLTGKANMNTCPMPPCRPPPSPPKDVAAGLDLDPAQEIQRILDAEDAIETLNISVDGGRGLPPEAVVTQAWKRLVLLLHPDKLQRLDAELREKGAEALHKVHEARDELRQQAQQVSAEVPEAPVALGYRYLDDTPGARKVEISWQLPESQDPSRPVEKYEVWGPRYFSEAGDPFDWVLLATLPQLQSQFVVVEEAPTQQDVMWAADRVLRPTLPFAVHAVNGRGPSEALTFELPWASKFPWLTGYPSVLCRGCLRLQPLQDGSAKCSSCGSFLSPECKLVVRCHECHGEVLWSHGSGLLGCSCCLRNIADASACRVVPPFPGRPRVGCGGGGGRGAPWGGRAGGTGRVSGGWGGRAGGGGGGGCRGW